MVDTRELIEALHYIKKFKDQVFIIKFGGEILSDEKILETIALDLVLLHDVGIHQIVMHGAGNLISSEMKRLGLEPEFIRGERVTDRETLSLVTGCLHYVNNKIVGKINKNAAIAVGLAGGLFEARRKRKELGYVGDITAVNSRIILELIEKGHLPVVMPIGIDKEGNSLNINADVSAGELARELNAMKMIILTHVEGVLDENGELISKLNIAEAKNLLKRKVVTGGMIPKLESGIRAISRGVDRVHIVKAGEHAILGELLTEEGTGTMITRK
ncbi:MAG: acetylglutamate kinase [Candidatus Altiarchaeales archaeon ex4484_43]|nr:MAG: acetylglutamate kinase [Candidatus Altiarchaeales archaeon ex4484_43]